MSTNRISKRSGSSSALKRFLPPLPFSALLMVGYFLAATFSISLTAVGGALASFWAATGILVVALVRRPRTEWPLIAVVIWLVDTSASFVLNAPLGIGAGIATIDVLEGLAGATLILRASKGSEALDPGFLFFGLLAILLAAGGAATLGAAWLLLTSNTPFGETWLIWFLADGLGTTIVAGALFVWTDPDFTKIRSKKYWAELILWTTTTGLIIYTIFHFDLPFLFAAFPPVLLATFRTGLFGATASAIVLAALSLWLTLSGLGPIAATQLDTSSAIHVAQAFIGVVFLSTFPLAVVLEADKKLKRQLRAARDSEHHARAQAEQALAVKANFITTISHEIRTPMNSIIGFTDLLMEDKSLDERQRRQVSLIQNSGSALLSVINDVLNFSMLEAGKIDLSVEPFETEALIDDTVAIIRGSSEEKGLDLKVRQDPRLARYYLGDENRLRQVMLNLLNNAIKFTHAGQVTLSIILDRASGSADALRFSIEDTGEGVAKANQFRLFKSYSQADSSVARRHGGTGLGLVISKHLIEAMGGAIGFSSSEREGSTFWFTVNLAKPDAPPNRHQDVNSEIAIRPAKILLAEDVPLNQELACAILSKDGHEVHTVDDGAEAVEAARHVRYDLILMDIQMPNMDGITATRLIRELSGRAGAVPIFAMTANVLPDQVKLYLAAGMNGFVAKPIKQVNLKAAINRALLPASSKTEPDEQKAVVVFDAGIFQSVRALLPSAQLKTHLQNFDLQLVDLSEASPAENLEHVAHKLVSQAGMLGFMDLSVRCRQLEQACRDGETDDAVLHGVKAAAEEARHRIVTLRAKLETNI